MRIGMVNSQLREDALKIAREIAAALAVKYPDFEPKSFLCHMPATDEGEEVFGYKGHEAFWNVLSKEQKGYGMADERIPYPEEEELQDLFGISHVDFSSLVNKLLDK